MGEGQPTLFSLPHREIIIFDFEMNHIFFCCSLAKVQQNHIIGIVKCHELPSLFLLKYNWASSSFASLSAQWWIPM